MSSNETAAPRPRTEWLPTAGRALGVVATLGLIYVAVSFYRQYAVHYIAVHTQASFGPYWHERDWLLVHIAGGTLALLAGPFQLWSGLGRRFLAVHRWSGRLYITGVLIAGSAAFYMSFFTQPHDFGVALFMLAVAWWTTSGMAYLAIRRHRIDAHRQWMIRSYVVTFAFVSFRWLVEQPVFQPLGPARYATVGWMCWAAPLLVAEVVLQWRHTVGPRRVGRT